MDAGRALGQEQGAGETAADGFAEAGPSRRTTLVGPVKKTVAGRTASQPPFAVRVVL